MAEIRSLNRSAHTPSATNRNTQRGKKTMNTHLFSSAYSRAGSIVRRSATLALAISFIALSSAGNLLGADGDLDLSFDPGLQNTGIDKIARQPDGKIIIAGSFYDERGGVVRRNIARLNEDGTFDSSFHATGFGINNSVAYVAFQGDGKILISGAFTKYDNVTRNYIARLNADGTLDQTFDPGTGANAGGDFVVQPDGKIIFAGGFTRYNDVPSNHVVRLNPNGSLDTSFRRAYEGPTGGVSAVALQPDGKILIAGDFIARLNPDGAIDFSFEQEAQFYTNSFGVVVFDIVLQPDARIIVNGFFSGYDNVSRNGIVRLLPNGALDTSFDPGSGVDLAKGVSLALLQPNGKIVIGGNFVQFNGVERAGLARLQPDGPVDVTFDPGTGVETRQFSDIGNVRTGALRPDGKIIIGGSFDTYDGVPRRDLAQILSAAGTPTPTPSATPTPTASPTPSATPTATASPTQRLLGNIATRMRVETGENVLIGGFIITGDEPKKLMLRAIGTSLPLSGKLQDPVLALFDGSGDLIRANDNWRDAPNRQEIIDSTIAPSNDLESAILITLPSGGGNYTAVVRGANGGTGIAIVEGYDLDQAANSKLANISTRGLVQTGEDVMIGGFFVLNGSQKVIVRALGPSLPVSGQLADPTLDLINGNGDSIAFNNNWRDTQQDQIEATTIPPSNQLESAVVATLPAGSYTAVVRGASNSTGVGLVEVYALD